MEGLSVGSGKERERDCLRSLSGRKITCIQHSNSEFLSVFASAGCSDMHFHQSFRRQLEGGDGGGEEALACLSLSQLVLTLVAVVAGSTDRPSSGVLPVAR